MLITPAEAARELGISKTAVYKYYRGEPDTWPDFIVRTEKGKIKIDTEHPTYVHKLENKRLGVGAARWNAQVRGGKRKKNLRDTMQGQVVQTVEPVVEPVKKLKPQPKPAPQPQPAPVQTQPPAPTQPPPVEKTKEELTITAAAGIAEMKKIIFTAEIQEQKSIQEKIKTMQIKKDLAPVDLVEHFFSFAENLIQRIYRRPHEISPQLEALYVGKESKKAIQLIIRELEGIIKDVQKELITAIEEEGFKGAVKGKGEKKDAGEKQTGEEK